MKDAQKMPKYSQDVSRFYVKKTLQLIKKQTEIRLVWAKPTKLIRK
jgi:hypothetical protein